MASSAPAEFEERDPGQCGGCTGPQPTTAFCVSCPRPLCPACRDKHGVDRETRSHRPVAINHVQIRALMCREHWGRYFEAYCTTCWRPVCGECQSSAHSGHNTRRLGPTPLTVTDYGVHVHRYQLDRSQAKLESISREFNSQLGTLRKQLSEHKEKVLQQVERQDTEMRRTLDEYECTVRAQLDATRRGIETSKVSMATMMVSKEKLLKPIPEIEDIGIQDVDGALKELKLQSPHTGFTVSSPRKFEFHRGTETVMFGYLVLAPGDSGSENPLEGLEICQQVDPQPIGRVSPTPYMPSNGTPSSVKWSTSIPHDITGLAFLANGDVIVGSKECVTLSFEEGSLQMFPFNTARLGGVKGLSTGHTHSAVVLTHWSSFTVFTPETDRWSSTAMWVGGTTGPVGFMRGGDVVVISSKGRSATHTFRYKREGKTVWQKDVDGNLTWLAVDWDDRILAGDATSGIQLYTPAGERSPTLADRFSQLRQPTALCVDSANNVLVADSSLQAVLRFDPEGHYMETIVNLDQIPMHLALYQDKHLVLATRDNRVTMYQL